MKKSHHIYQVSWLENNFLTSFQIMIKQCNNINNKQLWYLADVWLWNNNYIYNVDYFVHIISILITCFISWINVRAEENIISFVYSRTPTAWSEKNWICLGSIIHIIGAHLLEHEKLQTIIIQCACVHAFKKE